MCLCVIEVAVLHLDLLARHLQLTKHLMLEFDQVAAAVPAGLLRNAIVERHFRFVRSVLGALGSDTKVGSAVNRLVLNCPLECTRLGLLVDSLRIAKARARNRLCIVTLGRCWYIYP